MIYADYNATTPLDLEVRAAMDEALGATFGNPSSMHQAGQAALRLVDRARSQVATFINAAADEIVFTSGGTEADNLAVLGAAAGAPAGRRGVVASAVEHKAVLDPCAHWQAQGNPVALLRVDSDGRVDTAALEAAVTKDVALVSVMLANNDIGTLEPLADVVTIAKARGALVHTDAVQAAGKVPIDVKALGVSLLSFSSHKIHGPKGAGALFVRNGVRLAPLVHGGRQERTLRPGTENVPAIVGFGKACELAGKRLDADARRVAELRDHFEKRILTGISGTRVNGGAHRLPNTSNIAFAGLDGEAIVINLDMMGLAASTGAACNSADKTPSHVLLAMGQSPAQARSSVRFSFGRENTDEQIDRAALLVAQAVTLLREVREVREVQS
jgi:cysteine desulfurase